MSEPPVSRVPTSSDLGRSRRGFDLFLGTSAVAPILACAVLDWFVPAVPKSFVRALAVIWSASLLTFFAGVRRGLTFSEVGGGRPSELATMLGLFAMGVLSLVFVSPILAGAGLAAVGLLDAAAGRRREAPGYFAAFRPVQMAVCAVAMIAVQFRSG